MRHAGRLIVAVYANSTARALLTNSLDDDTEMSAVVFKPGGGIDVPAADVIVVDLCSTGAAGYEVIEKLMCNSPVPILACVAPEQGAEGERRALIAGAVDVVAWSAAGTVDGAVLRRRVRLISGVAVVRRSSAASVQTQSSGHQRRIVAIGASTGGPAAVCAVLSGLAGLTASVLLVQHLHENFMAGFISWLNRAGPLPVSLAVAGVTPVSGHVYVSPAGQHLLLAKNGQLALSVDPPGLHIPAIDVLFTSVAASAAASAVGILLTGMGSDGAAGLHAMREAGALTIAQDETTSAVYGMPKAAVDSGAASMTLPLQSISSMVMAKTTRARA